MKKHRIEILRVLAGSLLLIALVGCSSTNPPQTAPVASGSRYSIQQDRAPDVLIDVDSIPEVVPSPIKRTLAGNRSPYTVLGKSYRVLATEEGYAERGVASWYGEKFHGHQTSNGEVFDMFQVSAAHKTLPIPSFLRVTNLDNNRSIIVRVNDRGPFHGDRIVDLSYAAALKLGYADRGTARVQLESIMPPSDVRETRILAASEPEQLRGADMTEGKRFIQVGAFSDRQAAVRLLGQLEDITSLPVFIQEVASSGTQKLHRVRVGPIVDVREISTITERVRAANLGSPYAVTD